MKSPPMQFLQRVARSAVVWHFMANGLRVAGALFVLPLIVRTMSSSELGLWYVFVSLAGLTSLLDLGFSPTLTQAASYAWAGAERLKAIGISLVAPGSGQREPNYGLLQTLVGSMRLYYRFLAAIILALLVTAGSWWIWKQTLQIPENGSVRIAWLAFSLGTAYNILGSLWPSLLTGINEVRKAQQIFAVSICANYCALVVGLLLHWGIWSMVLGQILLGVIQRQAGKHYFNRVVEEKTKAVPAVADLQMIQILWPMAWRNGVLALGTFFIQSANTLICSGQLGLATTASYGLTLQIINLLMAMSMTWVLIKLPVISQWRAAKNSEEITALFISRLRIALLTYLAGAIAIVLFANPFLQLLGAKTLLLPTDQLVVILLIYLLEMNHSCHAAVVISENVNPFVLPALLSGVAVVTISALLTPVWSMWGIILSFGLVQLAFNNWWPILRATKGLGLSPEAYFKRVLGLTHSGQ